MQKNIIKRACALVMAAIMALAIPQAAFASPTVPAVGIRAFFEGQHQAVVTWYEPQQRITINLAQSEAWIYIGSTIAYINNAAITLGGQPFISHDSSFMYISDAAVIIGSMLPHREPIVFDAPATEHGAIARTYLEFIDQNLYNRIGYTLREREAAEWIADELVSMGHSPENVRIQEFPVTPWVMEIIPVLKFLSEMGDYISEIPAELQPLLAVYNIYTMADVMWHTFLDYSQNVILTVPGVSERRIIIGAHYDSPNSPGISDNASGTVTLMEAAYRILQLDHYYTITFIFFGAEEVGLVGAFYYAESLSEEEIENIALVVNVDVIFDGFDLTFGAGYFCLETNTEAANAATQTLLDIATALNAEHALGLRHEAYAIALSSDQLAFLPLGVQVLTFYSMRGWVPSSVYMDMLVATFTGIEMEPIISIARLELLLAMLDGASDEETLAAIEANRAELDFLMANIGMNDRDSLAELVELVLMMITFSDDEELVAELEAELPMLVLVLEVLDHPAFVDEGNGEMGLVLHTLNDNLGYLDTHFPGLVERALNAYVLFLERVITLPAGSLE